MSDQILAGIFSPSKHLFKEILGTPISQSSPYVLFISLLLLPPALALVSLLDAFGGAPSAVGCG